MIKIGSKNIKIPKTEKEKNWVDTIVLCPYLLYLKKQDLGELKCEVCGSKKDLELHHKKYGKDVTYYDLELLCYKCHLKRHNKKKK